MVKFRGNGKLLIAGEYTVLDGGLAFAVPTKLGQTLEVSYAASSLNPRLFWEAKLADDSTWFTVSFELNSLEIIESSHSKLAEKLQEIFRAVEQLKPDFFKTQTQEIHCKTQLEFMKDWGLGSSSTLIYLVAQWAKVDSFALSDLTFKTSGYDIACAGINQPIFYQKLAAGKRIERIEFQPPFIDQLYFVYLNQKQDTQIGVTRQYRNKPKKEVLIKQISQLVEQIVEATDLESFEILLNQHEDLLAEFLELPKVKDLYFSDYEGTVKSLGAWGGDFVLVTERPNTLDYFHSKGYKIVKGFQQLVY